PLSAGFNQVLLSIHDLDVSLAIDIHDVAGTEPAIRSPARGLFRHLVIPPGDPRTLHLQLAQRAAIPGNWPALCNCSQFDEWRGQALLGADLILLVVGPLRHLRL